jgi:chromosomal replication initiation ATPase DnaA
MAAVTSGRAILEAPSSSGAGRSAHVTPARAGRAILEEVARAYDLTPDELRARDSHPLPAEARRVAMQLLHEQGLRPGDVGRLLRRDRTTVYHHLQRIARRPTPEEASMLASLRRSVARTSS